ncbi:hypothetical protein ACE6H2_028148 [Prunus campanulata]
MSYLWSSSTCLVRGFKLERWVEEGICQVMSHEYGRWYCSTGYKYSYKTPKRLNFTRTLYRYRAELMKNHSNEIYRKGFNQVMQAVEEYGFQTTLNHIVKEKCLPHGCMNSKKEDEEEEKM